MRNLNLNQPSPKPVTKPAAKPLTVTDLNRRVKAMLEQGFPRLWVCGEVGNLTIHRSGHVYMTLKDERSQIKCVFFSGAAKAQQIGLVAGMQVEISGRITAYEVRGEYQIAIADMRPMGKGGMQQAFEELKKKLHAEGLFSAERKQSLPFLPRRVGVVTSPEGAAIRDFLQIADRRYSNLPIQVHPAVVQGASTAESVLAGLNWFNYYKTCDVIVITRGGGSMEDLWGFNNEKLARAVADSAIPVVSAVGHEVDFTICDFAADLRAPTPSAAAELVIPEKAVLQERVKRLHGRLGGAVELSVTRLRNRVQRAALHPVFHEPAALIRKYQQQVDELSIRAERQLENQLDETRYRLDRAQERLRLLNPKQVLSRGYSILLSPEVGAVTAAESVSAGDQLKAILHDGELTVEVQPSDPQG